MRPETQTLFEVTSRKEKQGIIVRTLDIMSYSPNSSRKTVNRGTVPEIISIKIDYMAQ